MNQFQVIIGNVLVPLGFTRIKPAPPTPNRTTTDLTKDVSMAWGKVVGHFGDTGNPFTLRVYARECEPVLTMFVRRYGKTITKFASERLVNLEDLADAVTNWGRQVSENDIVCNKCSPLTPGWYELGVKNNKEPVLVRCNRCCGKGFQNFNDRKKNEAYDHYMRIRQQEFDSQNQDEGFVLKPHWTPYDTKNGKAPK